VERQAMAGGSGRPDRAAKQLPEVVQKSNYYAKPVASSASKMYHGNTSVKNNIISLGFDVKI
jgi:hypothetical protein